MNICFYIDGPEIVFILPGLIFIDRTEAKEDNFKYKLQVHWLNLILCFSFLEKI